MTHLLTQLHKNFQDVCNIVLFIALFVEVLQINIKFA